MHKRFAPSFVMTVSALAVACSKQPSGEQGAIAPVPSERQDADKVEQVHDNPPAPKIGRKRVRTSKSPAKYQPASGTVPPWSDFVQQNPSDPQGRTIFVASDDSCFVQLPRKDQSKPLPPGAPWFAQGPVDCPAALDDPAWDDCQYGTLEAVKGSSDCYCVQPGGNPPPPPSKVACPKHPK
jgi:hypothetical protein